MKYAIFGDLPLCFLLFITDLLSENPASPEFPGSRRRVTDVYSISPLSPSIQEYCNTFGIHDHVSIVFPKTTAIFNIIQRTDIVLVNHNTQSHFFPTILNDCKDLRSCLILYYPPFDAPPENIGGLWEYRYLCTDFDN